MLKKIHHSSHTGIQSMPDLIRHAHVRIRDANSKITEIVKDYKVCQLTNTVANERNSGYKLCGRRLRAYWEIDFTEVNPKTFRCTCVHRYLFRLD